MDESCPRDITGPITGPWLRGGAYDATSCCGCDGLAPVAVPDFDGPDADGIEAAFGE